MVGAKTFKVKASIEDMNFKQKYCILNVDLDAGIHFYNNL